MTHLQCNAIDFYYSYISNTPEFTFSACSDYKLLNNRGRNTNAIGTEFENNCDTNSEMFLK